MKKKRQKKKNRKKVYKAIISDVTLDISLDSKWRRRIFDLPLKQKLEISYLNPYDLPEYIRKDVVCNKLLFQVEKVSNCNKKFDDNLIIFKFSAEEFPQIVDFSGNNPNII